MHVLLWIALFCAIAVAQSPINAAGTGCGTMFIRQGDCSGQSTASFYPFQFTFLFPPGTGTKTVNLQIAAVGNSEDWSLAFQPSPLTNNCPDSSTPTCGTQNLPW